MLNIKDQKENGTWICALEGRLDGNTSEQADKHLSELAGKDEVTDLILDLSSLDYLSSAGLRVFLMASKRAKSKQRQVVLAAPNDGVKQVLTISGFSSILQIYPDRATALDTLGS
ncbi:MAG: STAS domain-containing protein [Opitutales bacterium]|nr:STAS domain-containing protein [Opitutales bacterium]